MSAAEGYAVQYNGVALHIRKEGTLWIISLLNSGLFTAGSGSTLKKALDNYKMQEGRIIEEWKYEIGTKWLRMLQDNAITANGCTPVKYEISEEGKILKAKEMEARFLI